MTEDELARAVALQRQSYALLRWMAERSPAWADGPRHDETTLGHALASWLARHHAELPPELRPEPDDRAAIANLLASYLESTFDFAPTPGQRLYSPDAHCFCPMCSWMIELPRLTPRKLTTGDKREADRLRARALRALAEDGGVDAAGERVDGLAARDDLREALSLIAYARDLERRMSGQPTSLASLALWRGFAWTRTGAPRHGFQLTVEAIVDAQARLLTELRAEQAR